MSDETQRLLVVAPHPDDEILGVGGTMARFAAAGGDVTVLTVAAHMPPLYTDAVHQQTVREARAAHALIGVKESLFLDQPAVYLERTPTAEFNGMIARVVERVRPHVMLVPYYDRHIDHRSVFNAAMVAARPVGAGRSIRMLAAYETISETHWNAPHLEPNFTPNWCVDIGEFLPSKLDAIRCYASQLHAFPLPRSIEALSALALFRGSQAGMAYAEGFQILRMSAYPEELAGARRATAEQWPSRAASPPPHAAIPAAA